jgi:hypothetical protein
MTSASSNFPLSTHWSPPFTPATIRSPMPMFTSCRAGALTPSPNTINHPPMLPIRASFESLVPSNCSPSEQSYPLHPTRAPSYPLELRNPIPFPLLPRRPCGPSGYTVQSSGLSLSNVNRAARSSGFGTLAHGTRLNRSDGPTKYSFI